MHASYDQSDNFILSNTHTNSEINSEHGTFSLTTDGDTNIKGGNIVANVVDINIGGDLNMATMQDTYEQQGSSFGIGFSGGIGGSGSSSAQGGIPASVQNVNVSAGVTEIYRQTTAKAKGIVELSTNDSGKSEAENLDNLLNSGSVNVAGNIDNQTVKENVNFTDADFEGSVTVSTKLLTEEGRKAVADVFKNFGENLKTAVGGAIDSPGKVKDEFIKQYESGACSVSGNCVVEVDGKQYGGKIREDGSFEVACAGICNGLVLGGTAAANTTTGAAILTEIGVAVGALATVLGVRALFKDDAGAQAPGEPTGDDGYIPPKKGDGKRVKAPNGKGYGYPDKNGNVWVPTGPGGSAHGGPHWDVQKPGGGYVNVYPGGKTRGGKK
jgi:hypothetical protein